MLLLLIALSCSRSSERREGAANRKLQPAPRDLNEIIESGKLIALTDFSSSSYFIYKGIPMGFEYELLQHFCDEIGVDLYMKPVEDMDDITGLLLAQQGDIIAANFTVTNQRKRELAFTEPLMQTRQVLVQRMPENWWNLSQEALNKKLIKNPAQLIGKTIHVRKQSAFYTRLTNLMDEIGGIIDIQFADGLGTEKLIEMVADGQIAYTVADENIARLNKVYHPEIDIKTPLSLTQNVAWACRPNSSALVDTLNHWLDHFKNTEAFAMIHLKYFKARTRHKEKVWSEFSSLNGDKISPFDDIIKAQSKRIDWDWKLLAALIQKESKFNPEAQAWTGASGLMQLIPATAERFGADSVFDPLQNVHAGVSYLQTLQDYWLDTLVDSQQVIPFVLASYNVGLGHVLDAQRLAVKYDGNPFEWEHVAAFLELKAQPSYYQDEVVKHGYCRGAEPVTYVKEILLLWDHYKNTPLTKNDLIPTKGNLIFPHPARHG